MSPMTEKPDSLLLRANNKLFKSNKKYQNKINGLRDKVESLEKNNHVMQSKTTTNDNFIKDQVELIESAQSTNDKLK